ncbi:MAG TPA: alpha/beta fold hydrolase [Vicinamibacterales bacterium]
MITVFNGFLGVDRDWDFIRGIATDDRVLAGYSMGGRLALQALIDGAPFNRAVIVSAGLNLEEGREDRRARDEEWARRFESDPWQDIMADWNAQPVFGGHFVDRLERDYDRHELARQLRESSPGVLPPLAPRLHEITIPVLWIAGEHDQKYVDVGRHAVSLLPSAELWVCPNAGHRVPWEQPQAFAARLREFVGAR